MHIQYIHKGKMRM